MVNATSKKVSTDKHALYLASVQDTESDIYRIEGIYKELFRKSSSSFREDFSGTFALSCSYVCSGKTKSAIAIDLDREAIDYGVKNYFANLSTGEQSRLKPMVENSVKETQKVDITCAFNFSYSLLHTRKLLKEYFQAVYNSLNTNGMFIMDIFGGSESEILEVQERYVDNCEYLEPFTFEFERASFNPITRRSQYYIHFEYDEGTRIEKAFSYDFRMWSIPELRDVLEEVGFDKSLVFFENYDEEGFGNGEFSQTEVEENSVNWNAYVVGVKL